MYNMFKCVLLKVPLLNIEIFRTFREIRICRYYMHILFTNLYFVCLFVCSWVFVRLEIFHSYAREGLQILTYARHSWPLSSEGFFACHTYCDMVYKIKILKVSRQPDTVIYDVKGKKKKNQRYQLVPRNYRFSIKCAL